MRVVAILATFNEERFVDACLRHLIEQHVEVYLIDNCSTDRTVAIAERFLRRGLIGIESLPRAGTFCLREQLKRKEELAATLDADWFMHVDADEIHLSPHSGQTLVDALKHVEKEGYNTAPSFEFTFIPTREAPDHDHPRFQETMRAYYPFLPTPLHLLRMWKAGLGPVELAWSGGHNVRFPEIRICPQQFRMRHYLFLSVPHAIDKYVRKQFDPSEVQGGWHGWRPRLRPEWIVLPSQQELRPYLGDDDLDMSNPRGQHYLADIVPMNQETD